MMTPIHTEWSVAPWARPSNDDTYDSGPTFSPKVIADLTEQIAHLDRDTTVDGVPTGLLQDLLAAITTPTDWVHGAEIHDYDRDVTYRATINPQRPQELDHLTVVIRGHIDDNALRRVPVARIRRAVLAQVAADQRARAEAGHEDVVTFVPRGGLSERPSLEEVAELISTGHDRAWFHAAYPDVPPRTVDGWMRRARAKYPQTPPTSAAARETAAHKTPDGTRRSGTTKKEQKK